MIDAIHEEPLFKLEWPNQVLYINMKKNHAFIVYISSGNFGCVS